MYKFKLGDTVPFIARIAVTEDGVDVTSAEDFTAWAFSCQYKNPAGDVVHTVATPLVGTGPLVDCSLPSAVSATLVAGTKYVMDFRARDALGTVRSSATRTIVFESAVSVTP